MSLIDKQKEQNEENCLKQACILAKSKKAKTRNIMKMLEGDSVVREKNDSPDMIKKYTIGNETVFLGVEHFLVDQATVTKSGKTKSLAQEHKRHIMKDYEEGHALYKSNEPIPTELMKKLAEDTYQYAAAVNHYGYENLISAFQVALNKHLSKAMNYRQEIERYANGKPVKIAFLIEIHCFAKNLFLNTGRSVKNNLNALIPVYSDIVNLLEKIDSSKIDYVILYIQNVSDKNIANVIALETGNIAGCLRSQGIPIFEYCSDGVNIDFKNSPTERTETASYRINYEVVPDYHENYMERLIPGLQKAYTLRKQGKPFAAPRSIQGLMYAFGNDVFFVSDKKGELSVKTHFSKEEVIRRFDDFAKRYAIEENESEPIG